MKPSEWINRRLKAILRDEPDDTRLLECKIEAVIEYLDRFYEENHVMNYKGYESKDLEPHTEETLGSMDRF